MHAVILDMDGTIFDTERVYHDAWIAAGVPESLYFRLIGRGRNEIVSIFRKELTTPPEILFDRCNAERDRILSDGIPKKPGLDMLLEYLKQKKYRVALATSSQTPTAERNLTRAGVRSAFDAVIGGDQVVHGKPAPDIYLKAAQIIGCLPADCAVVEDSFNGVRSAHAAGMYPIMVPDLEKPDAEMQKLAAAIVPSLADVPAVLEARA